MKTNCWLLLGTMVATSAIAQVNTNSLWSVPAPAPVATNAPAPVAPAVSNASAPALEKKKVSPARRKKRSPATETAAKMKTEPTVSLVPGPAEVAVSNLVVRGQAGLKGEALTHVTKGDTVTVLSQINLDKHKAEEPAQWAKIKLPAGTKVWVNANFIDDATKVVRPKKLNIRGGPSENYSVLGLLERGTPVNEIVSKGNWMQIEAPTNAYAFVAAMYLKQEIPVTPPQPEVPTPSTTPVTETQPMAAPPTSAPTVGATETTAALLPPPPAESNATMTAEATTSEVDTNLPPPPPRVATHEGRVRHVTSIIEPTNFELFDPATGADIDYLYTTSTNLDISKYNGLHVIVTGEEGLVERWKNTPVMTIQKIQVVE